MKQKEGRKEKRNKPISNRSTEYFSTFFVIICSVHLVTFRRQKELLYYYLLLLLSIVGSIKCHVNVGVFAKGEWVDMRWRLTDGPID
jgi:hypothetical protein